MRGSIGVEYGATCLGNRLFLRRWRFRGGDVEILAYRTKAFHQIMDLQKYNQHAFLDQDNDSEKGLNKEPVTKRGTFESGVGRRRDSRFILVCHNVPNWRPRE